MSENPRLLIFSGPNGAGKTTFASQYLAVPGNELPFINADVEAQKVAPTGSASAAIVAARRVLHQTRDLVDQGESFSIETTLAGHFHERLIERVMAKGWEVSLHFLWLASEELAHARVAARVRSGGHDIPSVDIGRRYWRGLSLLPTYCSKVSRWIILDNSAGQAEPVSFGDAVRLVVQDRRKFDTIKSNATAGWSWLGTRKKI